MMKFVFFDKNSMEANVIEDVLCQENIPYKTRARFVEYIYMEDEEECNLGHAVEKMYDIEVKTDLRHFEYVKSLSDKIINQKKMLEKCFKKRSAKRKENV